MTTGKKIDFLVIGAGIIGINLALSLKRKFPDCHICILEKEERPGLHASGRNSGVLHAGFYYTADSMKARFCREGNKQLTQYCLERKLPINQCGKLVVTRDASELDGLGELLQRGRSNGVELHELTENETKEIEPRAITYQKALFSPSTSVVSPQLVVNALLDDVRNAGIELLTGTTFIECHGRSVSTSRGKIEAGYVVNAAGLYADKIALRYGFSSKYRILPFKGLYLYANKDAVGVKTNIYPVPNLGQPFLGVHFTVDVEGRTKIGPTAMPAFWREQYEGWQNFSISEMMEIVMRDAGLFISNNFGFRKVALEEMRKRSKSRMAQLAGEMVRAEKKNVFECWGKPGIRAQLVNIREKKLEMDFCYEGDKHSFHVLNAVSPAFTCSMPFSDYLTDRINDLIH